MGRRRYVPPEPPELPPARRAELDALLAEVPLAGRPPRGERLSARRPFPKPLRPKDTP